MTMEEITICEFDFALINEFFTELERQGPGSPEETIRALGFIGNLSNKTKIADLGCGTGFQTMVLAQNTEATITALDLYAGSSVRQICIRNINSIMDMYFILGRRCRCKLKWLEVFKSFVPVYCVVLFYLCLFGLVHRGGIYRGKIRHICQPGFP